MTLEPSASVRESRQPDGRGRRLSSTLRRRSRGGHGRFGRARVRPGPVMLTRRRRRARRRHGRRPSWPRRGAWCRPPVARPASARRLHGSFGNAALRGRPEGRGVSSSPDGAAICPLVGWCRGALPDRSRCEAWRVDGRRSCGSSRRRFRRRRRGAGGSPVGPGGRGEGAEGGHGRPGGRRADAGRLPGADRERIVIRRPAVLALALAAASAGGVQSWVKVHQWGRNVPGARSARRRRFTAVVRPAKASLRPCAIMPSPCFRQQRR